MSTGHDTSRTTFPSGSLEGEYCGGHPLPNIIQYISLLTFTYSESHVHVTAASYRSSSDLLVCATCVSVENKLFLPNNSVGECSLVETAASLYEEENPFAKQSVTD